MRRAFHIVLLCPVCPLGTSAPRTLFGSPEPMVWQGRPYIIVCALMRKTEKSVLAASLLLACGRGSPRRRSRPTDAHRGVYKKGLSTRSSPSAPWPPLGERSGSGVIPD